MRHGQVSTGSRHLPCVRSAPALGPLSDVHNYIFLPPSIGRETGSCNAKLVGTDGSYKDTATSVFGFCYPR